MDDPDYDDESENNEIPPADLFFLTAVGFETGIGVIAIVVGILIGPVANALVPHVSDWWGVTWGVVAGTIFALPMVALTQWMQKLNIPQIQEINQFGREHIMPAIEKLTSIELVAISLCAGVGEELLFRGWLQTFLTGTESEWTATSLVVGITIASIAFGMAHAVTKLYAIVVCAMGFVFGIMLVATGNLLVPIAAHAMFDFIQLQLAAKEYREETK